MRHNQEKQEGIALLITLLLMGVLLSIGASLLNITLKQYQFSGLALASEAAFQVANAGMECVLYTDLNVDTVPDDPLNPDTLGVQSIFSVPGDGSEQTNRPSISCMGVLPSVEAENYDNVPGYDGDSDGFAVSGEEQRFQFDYGGVCTEVSVYKYHSEDHPESVTVRGVDMRKGGANCPVGGTCTVVQSRGYNVPCSEVGSNPRAVEREYTQVY